MNVSVGIDAIALAVPRRHLELTELAQARGVPAGKYLEGIGTQRMAVAGRDEDPVTLAADAARRVFEGSGRSPSEIGLCVVGTETAVDHSKPVAAFLHGILGLPSACRVFETKHACFGGTAGLMNAIDWIVSGSARGRSALIVCTDIARYTLGSAGEPTQGAGAVAMIVSAKPRLVELEAGRSGSFSHDVYDFWRPLHRKDALVDGHFSVQCYLDALAGAYNDWREHEGHGAALARTCYHVPYGKMARKAHRARRAIDGLSEQAADASFAAEVAPSLILPSLVGNVYTGSLYMALASLLHHEAAVLEEKRIGLFSYGSGCAAEFFAGTVAPGAAELMRTLAVDTPIRDSKPLTMAEYEALRRADATVDPAIDPSAPTDRSRVAFLGVDEGERRVYASA